MPLDGPRAQDEPSAIASFVNPSGHELEDLELARGSEGGIPRDFPWCRGTLVPARKLGPGRLVLEQDVVGRLEEVELCARYELGEKPSLLDRHHAVIASMDDQCLDIRTVGATSTRLRVPRASKSRAAVSAEVDRLEQVVVPLHLLGSAVGEEEHAEHATECRVRSLPAGCGWPDQGFLLDESFRVAVLPSPRIAAVEHEVG